MRHLEAVRNTRNRKLPTDNISITNSCNKNRLFNEIDFHVLGPFQSSREYYYSPFPSPDGRRVSALPRLHQQFIYTPGGNGSGWVDVSREHGTDSEIGLTCHPPTLPLSLRHTSHINTIIIHQIFWLARDWSKRVT